MIVPRRPQGAARGMLCQEVARCGAGRRIGALVPACLLIGRLTFVMFPDSYKTSPEGTMAGASGVGDWSGS